LVICDELLVHSRFRAAHDLASYLATTSEVGPARRSVGRSWRVDVDLRVVVFLRLKAILAAIEGGLYQRARAELNEVEGLIGRVSSKEDDVGTLLRANVELLWGRLLQLFFLPVASQQRLSLARRAFEAASRGVPSGLSLLRYRTAI